MEHVGTVVDDLAAASAFFVELVASCGPRRRSRAMWRTAWWTLRRPDGVAMLKTADGRGGLDLVKFHARPPGPATGRRP